MILIDLNQVILSGLMAQISGQKNTSYNEDLIRHMVLNTLRNHIKKFKGEYGEVILCCDNRTYWRKGVFPYYKAGRKKSREKSNLDWHLIFDILANIKNELKEYFPYKVIDVENAEADDIIGTLTPRFAPHQDILILSSDGDFLQLQMYEKVKQYNPVLKKFIKSHNPTQELKEKIIRGDKGDGIPNILSPANCFVIESKQKSITQGKLKEFMMKDPDDYDENTKIGFNRNKILIDLTYIPVEVRDNIIKSYEDTKVSPRSKLLNYFIEKKLTNLIDVIGDF